MSKKPQRSGGKPAPGKPAQGTLAGLLEEAMRARGRGDRSAAELACRRALAKHPGHPDGLHVLGLVLRDGGDRDGAARAIRGAIGASPRFAVYHVSLARVLAEGGDLDGSIAALEQAVSLDETLLAAVYNLGLAYEQRGDLDDAEAHYRWAGEGVPEASFNLGNLLVARGRIEDGVAAYEQALALRPDYARALANLGYAHQKAGSFEAASEAYRRLLAQDPEDVEARHMLAALTGERRDRADAAYVARFFDDYAARFESVLLGDLAYDTPSAIAALAARFAPPSGRFAAALDLGCGTGLSGRAVRDRCDRLVGVDLSPKMLDVARERGGYDALHVAELGEFLQRDGEAFDLVIASDVFNYLGDLAPTFGLLRARATEGTVIVFSTELGEAETWQLERTGRFRHTPAYVEATAAAAGLVVRHSEAHDLRKERGVPVRGQLYLLGV